MTILLIGCGRMGSAMARGWIGQDRILAYDPHTQAPEGVEQLATLDADALPADTVIVLAVKPQIFPTIATTLAPLAARGGLVLSIMAGITLDGLSTSLGGSARIVRAMPNTPAAIGKGITAAIGAGAVSDADRALVGRLLEATGQLVWLDGEADMDAVTAVSGSGPAYFFRITEALAKAGEAAGLSPELAMKLARATFVGSAALAEGEPASLAQLREQVTSPGGTTAAGLGQMDADRAADALMDRVVAAAAKRSKELASS
jgi:pyrroline-5-carboxylate reductase